MGRWVHGRGVCFASSTPELWRRWKKRADSTECPLTSTLACTDCYSPSNHTQEQRIREQKTNVKINREIVLPDANLWLLHVCASESHMLTSTPTKTYNTPPTHEQGGRQYVPGHHIMGNGSEVDCWPSKHGVLSLIHSTTKM